MRTWTSQRFRVSVRLADYAYQRWMLIVDLSECQSVLDLIKQINAQFLPEIKPPAVTDQSILLLEPDSIISSLDTLRENDNLLLTTLQDYPRLQ